MIGQENVDRSVVPPKPALPILIQLTPILVCHVDSARQARLDYRPLVRSNKDVYIDVAGCSWLQRAVCERQRPSERMRKRSAFKRPV